MKVTDIISQSDSQCLTPGYLSAHNLTERGDRSLRGFPLSLCYPSSLHLVTCLSFAELLWVWAVHVDATQMLLHYNNLSHIRLSSVFVSFFPSVSIPCCVWTRRAVSKGLNWLLNAFIFLIKYFDHGHMYRAYVCVL